MKRKIVLSVVCIVLAVAIGFVLIPGYNEQAYKKTTAVRAAADIPEGTLITDEMLVEESVFEDGLPAGTLTSAQDAVGQYAGRYISNEDYVTESKLTQEQQQEEIMTTGNKRIVSVSISSVAAGVSGVLEAGDLVSVYVIPQTVETESAAGIAESALVETEAENSETEEAPLLSEDTETELPDNAILPEDLTYIEVAAIYGGETNSDNDDELNVIPTTVSFYADEAQAKELVEIENGATLQLVFVARGDERLQYLSEEDLQL